MWNVLLKEYSFSSEKVVQFYGQVVVRVNNPVACQDNYTLLNVSELQLQLVLQVPESFHQVI